MPIRVKFLSGVLASVLLMAASPSEANRFLDNPEEVLDRASDTRFNPVGELESIQNFDDRNGIASHAYGTGVIVSPCLILTNAHVVFGNDLIPAEGKDYSQVFRAGTSITSAFKGRTVAKPVLWGKRDFAGRNDWAILRLDACLGKRPDFGWFEYLDAVPATLVGLNVITVGFEGGNNRGVMSVGRGRVDSVDLHSQELKYSASTAPGSSGAPVIAVLNGAMKIVGIHTGGKVMLDAPQIFTFPTYSDAAANEFIPATSIFDRPDIQRLMSSDLSAFGLPNPRSALGPLP